MRVSPNTPIVARLALAFVVAAPLAGCISFGSKPPSSLLNLTATATPAIGRQASSANGNSITVEVPVAPQSVATTRVPVRVTPTTIAYVPKALWAEPPTRLFARLVSDTIAARTGRVVLSTVQAVCDPSAHLAGELRNFGLDAGSHEAVVTFDAALVRIAGKGPVEKRRFEARVPVATIDAASAGPALNDAANQVAAQVADWVGR